MKKDSDEIKFDNIELNVASFGYTIANCIDEILVYNDKGIKVIPNKPIRSTFYLIPNYKNNPNYNKKNSDLSVHDKDFKPKKCDTLHIKEYGGIARRFLNIDFSKGLLSANSDIISFANNFGLLTYDFSFTYWTPISDLAFSQPCDNLDSWLNCWKTANFLIYIADHFKKMNLDNFFEIQHEGKKISKCIFKIDLESIEPNKFWRKKFSLTPYLKNLPETIKLNDDLYICKALLSYFISDTINFYLKDVSHISAKYNPISNKIEKVYEVKNAKGAIFLDIASYFWENRNIIRCEYCKDFIDITNKNLNKIYHETCVNKYKMPIKRLRDIGKKDNEIADTLRLPYSIFQRRKNK